MVKKKIKNKQKILLNNFTTTVKKKTKKITKAVKKKTKAVDKKLRKHKKSVGTAVVVGAAAAAVGVADYLLRNGNGESTAHD